MEATDVCAFYQHDLQSSSFALFEEMRRKGQFCDLRITVQNHSIIAHRIIVAGGIPYFHSAYDLTDSESGEKDIAVQDNLDPKAVESLVLFAYTSKVDITSENVQSLLVAAQFLQLVQVRDKCSEFLSERLNVFNVVQVRELSIRLNNSHLIDSCNGFIRKNFEEFSKTSDFLGLSHSCVQELLSHNDLVVSTEEVTFEALMRWVKFSLAERQVVLPELLAEIRMIYLPVSYLINRVETEELVVNWKHCRDLVNKVKNCHLMPEMLVEVPNLKKLPRNCFLPSLYAVCARDVLDNSTSDNLQLFIFSLINNKWFAISCANVPLGDMDPLDCIYSVVFVNGKIYIFLKEIILTFNPENNEWEELAALQWFIKGDAAAVFERKIYCFGHYNSTMVSAMVYFDTQSHEWSEATITKALRWDIAAASLGEFIYVTGGFNGKTSFNTVEKYRPSENQWMDVSPMLHKRYRHGCTSINGKIYVFGGFSLDGTTMSMSEMYDPLTDEWKSISSMESGKRIYSLVPHCGKVYAFGERNIEVYEPETDEWKSCSLMPRKCRGAVSVSTVQNDAT